MKNPNEPIQRVGLIANCTKETSGLLVQQAARLIRQAGREVYCEVETARHAGLRENICSHAAELAGRSQLLLVFGGDGTMLRVVREIQCGQTPLLGINVGRLGFLTTVPSSALAGALEKIWNQDYRIESRPLIEAAGQSLGRRVILSALNDIVISRGAELRMIELEVYVNDEMVTRYRCDGLIVSSPTGSTAYSLSAGGALVSPEAEVFSITPICPHTLSNRSVLVSLNSTVTVKVLSEKIEVICAADGQVQVDLTYGDAVSIRRSQCEVKLLHLGGTSFFDTVRQKLHWSGSNV